MTNLITYFKTNKNQKYNMQDFNKKVNDDSTLGNNEELVLRWLYSGFESSKSIPQHFFGEKEKENLLQLKLISLDSQGFYHLTPKAVEVLENRGFIIKYPLHDENGVVMNFVSILNNYSDKALRALGLSILSTESYKRWTKKVNNKFFEALKESMHYYNSKEHPLTRLDIYHKAALEAETIYISVLDAEVAKITPFKLANPILLGHQDGKEVKILEVTDSNEYTVQKGDIAMSYSQGNSGLIMTSVVKMQLIRQFFAYKTSTVQV